MFNATAGNTSTSGRGSIDFGIFSGSHVIAYRERPIVNTIEDSYFVCKLNTQYNAMGMYNACVGMDCNMSTEF